MKPEILNQIEQAKKVLAKNYNGKIDGVNAVITASKSSPTKTIYGFVFLPENTVNIGDVLKNLDGYTTATVEAIV